MLFWNGLSFCCGGRDFSLEEKVPQEHLQVDIWSRGLAKCPPAWPRPFGSSLNSSRPRNSWVPPVSFFLPPTNWFPFRDDCSTNPQPTRNRKPDDEDNKLCPGPQARRGEEWLMSPYILLLHSKSCLPQGLNHSLRATPHPDRPDGGGRPVVVCWLGEGDAVRALAGFFFSLRQIFWTGWWPWLSLGRRHRAGLLSRGSLSSL